MNKLIIFLLLAFTSKSFACKCAEVDFDIKKYMDACKSLYISRLISAEYFEAEPDPKYATFSKVKGKLAKPTKIYKGSPSHIIGLETSMLGSSCEGHLSVGEEYLVCGGKEKVVKVAQCGFTSPIRWGDGRLRHELLEKHQK